MSAVGEVFARRYELLDPIADGGMGSVWRVLDHVDGTVKAAKLLRQRDAGSLLRFIREQGTRVVHPHVVTPLSWVGEDDAVLFTMPLVRGGSVATLVGDWGPLPEQWVATLVDQTLAALEAVHRAGVVHRDVKPANLLLEPTGAGRPHVRLSDFGVAAVVGEPRLTTADTALGTPGYAAPEQQAGADPAPAQDLYAVGIVGLEMLVGHPPPFTTAEIPSGPLAGLLVAASNPDPALRPSDASAMRAALAPHLPTSWDPAGVEVLEHFPGGDGSPEPGPRPAAGSSPTVVLERVSPRAPSVDGGDRTRSGPPVAAILTLGLVGLALVLLALVSLLG